VNYLLDTHLILWAAVNSAELPITAARIIADKDNKLVVSVASLWEVTIKRSKAGPEFPFDAGALRAGLIASGYEELPVHARHILHVQSLPRHHSDPFDRLFVAQAASEGLILLTADRALAAYGGNVRVV
jgi:PIN domain nuclease of toxin-antitoxin system